MGTIWYWNTCMHCMMLKSVVKSTRSSTNHEDIPKPCSGFWNKLNVMCPQQPTMWWPLGLLILTAGFDFVQSSSVSPSLKDSVSKAVVFWPRVDVLSHRPRLWVWSWGHMDTLTDSRAWWWPWGGRFLCWLCKKTRSSWHSPLLGWIPVFNVWLLEIMPQ